MKSLDAIVQEFINKCSIKNHMIYQRSENEDGDSRTTYYPFADGSFEYDYTFRSKQCSADATNWLVTALQNHIRDEII